MDVGILFDLRNPDAWHRPWADHYARSLEFCEEADRRGAAGVWFTEHHLFEDGYLPSPLTFAAAPPPVPVGSVSARPWCCPICTSPPSSRRTPRSST